MSDMDRLREIREREAKATKGPWFSGRSTERGSSFGKIIIQNIFGWMFLQDDIGTADDADFIANARTDIPVLLDQLAERDAELVRLREALEMLSNQRPERRPEYGESRDTGNFTECERDGWDRCAWDAAEIADAALSPLPSPPKEREP